MRLLEIVNDWRKFYSETDIQHAFISAERGELDLKNEGWIRAIAQENVEKM